MRRQFIAGLVALTAVLGAGSGSASAHDRACMPARIGGRVQCLAPGLQCKRRYEPVYNLYGFTCARGGDGRFRLRDRLYVGPAVPEPGG